MCQQRGIILKFSHILYVWSPKSQEVYRLQVGGGSVANLWEYLASFGSKDTVFRYLTRFGSQDAISKETGQKFVQMTFEKVGEYGNWKQIFSEVQNLNLMLDTPVSKKAEMLNAPQSEGLPEVVEDEPVPETETEDEIKVEDIPF